MIEYRVLVTGANGFIGSHIVDECLRRKYITKGLVRDTSNLNFLEDAIKNKNFRLIYGDLRNPEKFKEEVIDNDLIFYAGAAIGAFVSEDEYMETNVEGLKKFLEIALESKLLKRFVFISSVASIGANFDGIVDERYPQNPKSPYGVSKLSGEKILFDYYEKYKFPVTIIEPPGVYGPRARVGFLPFLNIAGKRWFPTMDGNSGFISLIYIDDLIDGIMKAALNENAIGKRFIIGGPRLYTYNEIINEVSKSFGVNFKRWKIPVWFLKVVFFLIEMFFRIIGK